MIKEIHMTIYDPPLEREYGSLSIEIERLANVPNSNKTEHVLLEGEYNFATSQNLPEEAVARVVVSTHAPKTDNARAYINSVDGIHASHEPRPFLDKKGRIRRGIATEIPQLIVNDHNRFAPILEAHPTNPNLVVVRRTITQCPQRQ